MKFEHQERVLETSGHISSKAIGMNAGAKAFKILFGTMYPDIIKAVVREIFTNAWDSQKNAGTLDIPIEIHSPTAFEPIFSVRDFGTGMTKQQIDDIYSVVFTSSKDTSNDEAGFMGMGSKTPLGYSDSFMLVSYKDGMMYFYDIHLDETGSPVISLKMECETQEPNGVLVQLAVKPDDFKVFENHIKTFCFGAMTPINVNGSKYENIFKTVFSGEGWQLVESASFSKACVRMGPVVYTLNEQLLVSQEGYRSSTHDLISTFCNASFILDFDIGEFEVTGSREDIIYNRLSYEKIKSRILKCFEEINVQITKEVDEKKTWFEVYDFYLSLKNSTSRIVTQASRNIIWKGKKFFPGYEKPASYFTKKGCVISKFDTGYSTRLKTLSEYSNISKIADSYSTRLTKWKIVYWKQGLKRASSRLKQGKDNGSFSQYHTLYVELHDERALKYLLAYTRAEKVIDLSTIEPKKIERSKKDKKDKTKIYYVDSFDTISNPNYSISYGQKEADFFDKKLKFSKYYIETFRNCIKDDSKYSSAIKFFNIGDRKIPVFSKTDAEKAKALGLVEIKEAFEAAIAKIKLNTDEIKNLYVQSTYDRILNNPSLFIEIFPDVYPNTSNIRPKISGLYKYIKENNADEIKKVVGEVKEKLEKYNELPVIKFLDFNVTFRHTEEAKKYLTETLKGEK